MSSFFIQEDCNRSREDEKVFTLSMVTTPNKYDNICKESPCRYHELDTSNVSCANSVSNYDQNEISTEDTENEVLGENEEETNDETAAQRIEREERESEQLAWEMMRQESMELHEMQLQFMRENAGGMSEEDLQALQMAIDESSGQNLVQTQTHDIRRDEEQVDVSGEEVQEEEEEDDVDNWDYDRLLSLGQALGDVKTERWRLRAKSIIDSLPSFTYSDLSKERSRKSDRSTVSSSTASVAVAVSSSSAAIPSSSAAPGAISSDSTLTVATIATSCADSKGTDTFLPCKKICCNTGYPSSSDNSNSISFSQVDLSRAAMMNDHRCNICIENFEPDETLTLLPCMHYFHSAPCATTWLSDHNCCPICKKAIAASP
jgi:hypothetical protein